MVRPRVAIVNSKSFGRYTDAVKRLEEVAEVDRIEVPKDVSGSELASKLSGYHFVVASVTPRYDRKFFEGNDSVVMIVRHGIGVDNVDLDAAREHGVVVARVPGWKERDAVAEHTIALMLAALRRVVQASNAVREGRWADRGRYVGRELRGLVVGVIGFGNIGSRVAEILSKGFRCRVLVYDPYVSREKVEEVGAQHAELDELLSESDVITLHAVLTPETFHMLGEREFAKMKKGVVVVNTARGELIDTEALLRALEDGTVAAAALDVVEGEPIGPDHPLLRHENVVVTPHIAAYTYEALRRMDEAVVEAIVNYLRGESVEGAVVVPSNPRRLST